MNKVLAFIELMGRDARLAESPASELASAARAAGVEPRLAEALARRDHAEFRRLLPALLLSLGLALPLRGYALVAAPDEQSQDTQESAPEEEEKPAQSARAETAPAESAPADDAAPPPEPEIESDTSDEEGEADDSSDFEATDDAGDEEEETEDPGEDSDSAESDEDDFMVP